MGPDPRGEAATPSAAPERAIVAHLAGAAAAAEYVLQFATLKPLHFTLTPLSLSLPTVMTLTLLTQFEQSRPKISGFHQDMWKIVYL